MTNMTLAVPEDLHDVMQRHKEIRWSEIARQALWLQAKKLELMDKILSKSRFAEADAEAIGEKIKRGIAKRHGLAG